MRFLQWLRPGLEQGLRRWLRQLRAHSNFWCSAMTPWLRRTRGPPHCGTPPCQGPRRAPAAKMGADRGGRPHGICTGVSRCGLASERSPQTVILVVGAALTRQVPTTQATTPNGKCPHNTSTQNHRQNIWRLLVKLSLQLPALTCKEALSQRGQTHTTHTALAQHHAVGGGARGRCQSDQRRLGRKTEEVIEFLEDMSAPRGQCLDREDARGRRHKEAIIDMIRRV